MILVVLLASLVGCSTGTQTTAPVTPTLAQSPDSAVPSPEVPPGATFTPATWDYYPLSHRAPTWRLRIEKPLCGAASLILRNLVKPSEGAQDACKFPVHGKNIGMKPSAVSHLATGLDVEPGPLDAELWAYDSTGRTFQGSALLAGTTNPGLGVDTMVIFEVPTGVTLVRLQIGTDIIK